MIGLGEMEAYLAVLDPLFRGADGVGQLECFLGGAAQQVMREPFGGLGPDAGKPSQGGDQSIHGGRVSGARHRQ